MIRNILAAFLLAIPALTFGQPVLTVSDYPSAGFSLLIQNCDTNVNEGSAGQNVVWDFSNASPIGNPVTSIYDSSSGTPFFSQFPNSDLVITTLPPYSYGYEKINGDTIFEVGSGSPYSLTIYNNPLASFIFPITFNTSYADSFTTTTYSSGDTLLNSGFQTATCDGYGTLILPSGVFENVLRIRTESVTIYELPFGFSDTFHLINYYFQQPEANFYLAFVDYDLSDFEQQGIIYKQVYINSDPLPTFVKDPVSHDNFTISPNPASEFLNVHTDQINFIRAIAIRNCLGEKVITENFSPMNKNSLTLSVKSLPPAIYFMEIDLGDRTEVRKFMKQ